MQAQKKEEEEQDLQEIRRRLRARGILIRDCSSYPGLDAYYARIAVRTQKENQTLVQAMEEAIQC